MIQLEDTIIQASMTDVVVELRYDLRQRGLERFKSLRLNGDNIQTECPFHKGGQERKPSFGVNIHNGKCHCFTCNWSGTIDKLVSEVFGYDDGGKYGLSWLQKKFNSLEIENRELSLNIDRQNHTRLANTPTDVEREEKLKDYRWYHPYMYERGLTDEIIDKFDIGYDKENDCITFPVRDIRGNLLFVATRSVKGKFFGGIPKGENKPVYLADAVFKLGCKEVYITESFFNCLTCWKYGKPAVALLGTGNKSQYELLKRLPVRTYIIALDPDEAGRKGTQRLKKFLGDSKLVKELVYDDDSKDINDLQESFLKLEKTF